MIFPTQIDLKLPEYAILRPLMSIETVKGLLDCSEDEVLAFIQEGVIQWAWDLRGAASRRSHIRVWSYCVEEAKAWKKHRQIPTADNRPHSLIFFSIFKHSRPVLLSTEVIRAWNCGSDHVHDLVKAGLLTPTKTERDRNEAAPLTRASVEKFMQERQM